MHVRGGGHTRGEGIIHHRGIFAKGRGGKRAAEEAPRLGVDDTRCLALPCLCWGDGNVARAKASTIPIWLTRDRPRPVTPALSTLRVPFIPSIHHPSTSPDGKDTHQPVDWTCIVWYDRYETDEHPPEKPSAIKTLWSMSQSRCLCFFFFC